MNMETRPHLLVGMLRIDAQVGRFSNAIDRLHPLNYFLLLTRVSLTCIESDILY